MVVHNNNLNPLHTLVFEDTSFITVIQQSFYTKTKVDGPITEPDNSYIHTPKDDPNSYKAIVKDAVYIYFKITTGIFAITYASTYVTSVAASSVCSYFGITPAAYSFFGFQPLAIKTATIPFESLERLYASMTVRNLERALAEQNTYLQDNPEELIVSKAILAYGIGHGSSMIIGNEHNWQNGLNAAIYDTSAALGGNDQATMISAELLDAYLKSGKIIPEDIVGTAATAFLLGHYLTGFDMGVELIDDNLVCVSCFGNYVFDTVWDPAAYVVNTAHSLIIQQEL